MLWQGQMSLTLFFTFPRALDPLGDGACNCQVAPNISCIPASRRSEAQCATSCTEVRRSLPLNLTTMHCIRSSAPFHNMTMGFSTSWNIKKSYSLLHRAISNFPYVAAETNLISFLGHRHPSDTTSGLNYIAGLDPIIDRCQRMECLQTVCLVA